MKTNHSSSRIIRLVLLPAVVWFGTRAYAEPANDDFANATVISALPFADETTMSGATLEPLEPQPSCGFSGGNFGPVDHATVWYRFMPSENVTLSANTAGSDDFTVLAAYKATGSGFTGLEEVGCDDEHAAGEQEVRIPGIGGDTYYFQVGVYNPFTSDRSSDRIRFALGIAPARGGLREIVPFETTVGGTTTLRGHVYLPIGDPPYATVLEYSPYWQFPYGNGTTDGQAVTEPDGHKTMSDLFLHNHFIEAGFAVVLVSIRGTGASDGCMQWGGPQDREDAAAVIEAIAQQIWSNGNVGMFGVSAPAWSQYWAAAAAPPSLKAVVPMSGIIDSWSWLTLKGAPIGYAPTLSTAFTTETALISLVSEVRPDHAACPRYLEDLSSSSAMIFNGDRTPYYETRDLRELLRDSKVPALVTSGLSSGEGLIRAGLAGYAGEGGHLMQFEGLWDLLQGDRHFLLGQWGHGYPKRPDFPAMAVAWFDHYLRSGPALIAQEAEYQDDSGAWHTADRWPPPSTPVTLRLSDSTLTSSASVQGSMQTFQGVGTPCVGFCPVSDLSAQLTAALSLTTQGPGPRLEACVGDQAIYTSPPLSSNVLLAGNFTVDLTVTSSLPDGNLAAYLWHTSGQGTCPDPEVKEVRRAVASLRHWQDERGRDFPLDVPTAVTLKSLPFASVIPAGDRLVLAIGGDSWGLFPKVKPRLAITTGPQVIGSVTLPVVDGSLELSSQ